MALSDQALMRAQDVRYCGPLEGATHHGIEGEPGEGAFLEVWLKVEEGVIRAAAYRTHGCPSSRITGSTICWLLSTGMSVERALEITAQDLTLLVGGLPEGKGHFAGMTIQALEIALAGK
jgi:nitrogen fixation protein NifU and related proteins